jgi:hypothetical protein
MNQNHQEGTHRLSQIQWTGDGLLGTIEDQLKVIMLKVTLKNMYVKYSMNNKMLSIGSPKSKTLKLEQEK